MLRRIAHGKRSTVLVEGGRDWATTVAHGVKRREGDTVFGTRRIEFLSVSAIENGVSGLRPGRKPSDHGSPASFLFHAAAFARRWLAAEKRRGVSAAARLAHHARRRPWK